MPAAPSIKGWPNFMHGTCFINVSSQQLRPEQPTAGKFEAVH